MDYVIVFFHCKPRMINRHKRSSKTSIPSILSTHLVLKTSLSLFLKNLDRTAVFSPSDNCFVAQIRDFHNICHQISDALFPTGGHNSKVQTMARAMYNALEFILRKLAAKPWFLPATAPAPS